MNNLDYGILNNCDILEGNLFQNNNEVISFRNRFEKKFYEIGSIQFTEYLELVEKAEKRGDKFNKLNLEELKIRLNNLKDINIFFENAFLKNKFIKDFSTYYLFDEEYINTLRQKNPYLNFKLLEEEILFVKNNIFKLNRAKRTYYSLFN